SEVRASVDAMARALRDMAQPLTDGTLLADAAQEDTAATRRLFELADAALREPAPELSRALRTSELALTAYSTRGLPVAWSGRPSELTDDRLNGDEAWFFTQGELGLRLVFVRPVVDGSGRRVGTIAAERGLTA